MTSIFIGLVSHEGSRFAESQGPDGLAMQLATSLQELGASTQVHINTANLLDTAQNPITEAMTQASLTAQLHLERTWARFLQRSMGIRWWAIHGLRWSRRTFQRIQSPGPDMTKRLLNIELSHRDLLQSGISSGSEWILVLEDDASSNNITDCAHGMLGLMRDDLHRPRFVNISQSFTTSELGIDALLTAVPEVQWQGTQTRFVLQSYRPVTNTVCAILYRASFAQQLLATFDELPMEPVVPIDWKLNLALMAMYRNGYVKSGDCWLIDPAPIVQTSMHTVT